MIVRLCGERIVTSDLFSILDILYSAPCFMSIPFWLLSGDCLARSETRVMSEPPPSRPQGLVELGQTKFYVNATDQVPDLVVRSSSRRADALHLGLAW